MRTRLTTALGIWFGTVVLTACTGVSVPPAYTQDELAARCVRTGGWWKDSRSYSEVSGHCEYKN